MSRWTRRSVPRRWRPAAALLLAGLVGCAFGYRDHDVDNTPIVQSGAGASILDPGQAPPSYDPGRHGAGPPGGTIGGTPAASAPRAPGAPPSATGSSGGGSVTFLGGSESDEVRHTKVNEEPIWAKYLTLPFAVVAAPFQLAAEKLRGEPEPGTELPRATARAPQAPPAPPARDYDSLRLAELERELDARQAATPEAAVAPAPSAGPPRRAPSIAEELAALERGPARSEASGGSGPGRVDRDADGRVDQWIYRENGRIVREVLDDDFDGRPERTLLYDRQSGEIRRIDEDTDQDGRIDAWSEYRSGRLVTRRGDADHDGRVDTWTSFRDGEIVRIERDISGDGRPDHFSFYGNGGLTREERDLDGDGRSDLTVRYDENQRVVTREEDTDGDGRIDVISHYEGGRLARREFVDPSDVAEPGGSR